MSQVIRSPKMYDVCIIGSGAGGGMAAKILTEGGLNVALLEAGPPLNPEKDFKMMTWPYELPHRGAGVGGHARENFGEFLAPNGAWTIEGEPYTSAPGSNFQWFRSRIVGGRTNHWGRIALRFAPIDFKSYTRDGLGDDWPIRLRRSRAVLRQSRVLHRRFRHEGKCFERARRHFSAASETAMHGADRQESLRQTEYYLHSFAARDPDAIRERPAAVPLLRPMRPRMHHGVEFQLEPGVDSSGDGNGQADDDHRRDGTRNRGRKRRQGARRRVH